MIIVNDVKFNSFEGRWELRCDVSGEYSELCRWLRKNVGHRYQSWDLGFAPFTVRLYKELYVSLFLLRWS